MGVDRMLKQLLRKRDGNMHGDGDKVFSKDFSKKPIGCHLCPGEMMSWVAT